MDPLSRGVRDKVLDTAAAPCTGWNEDDCKSLHLDKPWDEGKNGRQAEYRSLSHRLNGIWSSRFRRPENDPTPSGGDNMARITKMDSTKAGQRFGLVCFAIFLLAGLCFGQAAGSPSLSGGRNTTHVLTDWNQFLRNNMARWNPFESILTVDNVGKLELKWSSNVNPFSSPAVSNGVLYIGGGSNGYSVYALDAHTGAQLWTYATDGYVESSPAVANGVVYVGSDDKNVYALDAHTGAKLWSYTTRGYVESSPAVANGVVYIGVVSVGSRGDNVYAFNASTGTKLWSFKTVGSAVSSPAVTDGLVYVGSGSDRYGYYGDVYALNARTGTVVWRQLTTDYVFASPVVAKGVVYVADRPGNVYALNARTGAVLWHYFTGTYMYYAGAVAKGIVYVPSYGGLYAFNAHTGAMLWSYSTNAPVSVSPALANGVAYFGSNNQNVYAVNASTGALLWSYQTTGGLWVSSSPAVVNGVLYVGADYNNQSGAVYAFGLKHGAQKMR